MLNWAMDSVNSFMKWAFETIRVSGTNGQQEEEEDTPSKERQDRTIALAPIKAQYLIPADVVSSSKLKRCQAKRIEKEEQNNSSSKKREQKGGRGYRKRARYSANAPCGGGNGSKSNSNNGGNGGGGDAPTASAEGHEIVICRLLSSTGRCSYGTSCKFSHDIEGYLRSKPPDISTKCPVWYVRGYCPSGLRCRFGNSHIVNGVSTERTEEDGGVLVYEELNKLHHDTLITLKKGKYTFKCQRKEFSEYFKALRERDDLMNGANKDGSVVDEFEQVGRTALAATASSPLPKPDKQQWIIQDGGATIGEENQDHKPIGGVVDDHDDSMLHYPKKTVDFNGKVYVAPLTTVGNLPFRRCMKDFGADITCSEMALAGNLIKGSPGEWVLLKRHPSEDVFGVQLAVAHPDQATRASEIISTYCSVDFVDLNLGCPIDLVCNSGAGSSLMLRPRKLKGIVRGVSSVLDCPITIKMRTGWNDYKPVAHSIVHNLQEMIHGKGVEKINIAAVMVHGRSRLQRYTRLANWQYIKQVAASQDPSLAPIPVIGNGDIMSWRDCVQHNLIDDRGGGGDKGMSSCAMIGRGALIKPWLPTEIKERKDIDISATERLDIFKKFVNYGLEHWGSDSHGVEDTRRFLLEWMSFTCRYIPVGILEVLPQRINQRPPPFLGRSDLETMLSSSYVKDWIKVSEMLLGPVGDGFHFEPKHKSNAWAPLGGEIEPITELRGGDGKIQDW